MIEQDGFDLAHHTNEISTKCNLRRNHLRPRNNRRKFVNITHVVCCVDVDLSKEQSFADLDVASCSCQ